MRFELALMGLICKKNYKFVKKKKIMKIELKKSSDISGMYGISPERFDELLDKLLLYIDCYVSDDDISPYGLYSFFNKEGLELNEWLCLSFLIGKVGGILENISNSVLDDITGQVDQRWS